MFQEWISIQYLKKKTQHDISTYTDMFNKYNYSFHKPKKNVCDVCEKYKMLSIEDQEKEKYLFGDYIQNKTIDREKKNLNGNLFSPFYKRTTEKIHVNNATLYYSITSKIRVTSYSIIPIDI